MFLEEDFGCREVGVVVVVVNYRRPRVKSGRPDRKLLQVLRRDGSGLKQKYF